MVLSSQNLICNLPKSMWDLELIGVKKKLLTNNKIISNSKIKSKEKVKNKFHPYT